MKLLVRNRVFSDEEGFSSDERTVFFGYKKGDRYRRHTYFYRSSRYPRVPSFQKITFGQPYEPPILLPVRG